MNAEIKVTDRQGNTYASKAVYNQYGRLVGFKDASEILVYKTKSFDCYIKNGKRLDEKPQ